MNEPAQSSRVTAAQEAAQPGSGSIQNANYWWYRARARLMEAVLAPWLAGHPLLVDVGSADGPSVDWLADRCRRVPVDIDPAGLRPGGVCASALELPFADGAVDAVSAFDVVEHFPDDHAVLLELFRVLQPGGVLLASVPAYAWAWSDFDESAGHFRRYRRSAFVRALRRAGFDVLYDTYAFASTFPLFAADRLRGRLLGRRAERARDSEMKEGTQRALLALARVEERVIRHVRMPFGSSVFVVARKAG